MLAAERQNLILQRARRDGTVRTAELARELAVTEETIRRDLDFLARRGHVRRSHGGAMNASAPLGELSQSEREGLQLEEKIAIAREAARLLAPGETILLDASTSALKLAGQLPENLPLRVVTYSLAVVERLSGRGDLEVIQLGGTYDARGRRYSGMLTESALRLLKIDRFFFSGAGLDPVQGVSEPNPDQARLKRMMIGQAEWNCALIDHSKFGIKADHFFATPGDLDLVITDPVSRTYAKRELKKQPYETRFAR